jgi:hypothetical protein
MGSEYTCLYLFPSACAGAVLEMLSKLKDRTMITFRGPHRKKETSMYYAIGAVAVLVGVLCIVMAPDVVRYMKIRAM